MPQASCLFLVIRVRCPPRQRRSQHHRRPQSPRCSRSPRHRLHNQRQGQALPLLFPSSFVAGIDAIGGVDIELTQAEVEYINRAASEKNNIQHVSAGKNHLNGETALSYARCRKIDSDWFRIGRQRAVIQAALDQVSDLSLLEINDMLDTTLPLIQTNLTNREIFSLALNMPQFLGKKLEQATIPLPNTYGGMTGMGGRSLYSVDFETNAKALQEMLYGVQAQ